MASRGKLKILLLSTFFWPYQGGVEWHIYKIAHEFKRMGHEVGIVCSNTGDGKPDKDLNVEVVPAHGVNFPFYSPPKYYISTKLTEAVIRRSKEYDLVHLHRLWCIDYALAFLKVCRAIPGFFTAHEPLERRIDPASIAATQIYNDVITKRIVRDATVLAVSKYVARGFERAYRKKAWVVYNGVDARTLFTPSDSDCLFTKKFGVESRRYVLFVGRAVPEKGLKHLLRAFSALKDKSLHLVLISRGSDEYTLKILARYLRIHDRVHFVSEYVSEDELVSAYRNCLFFVLPSTWEAFGIVLLEAMGCGRPVIGSDTDGIPEVIGDAGLLVPPANPVALKEAMERLLSDGKLRERLGKAGRKRAVEHFSWKKVAERTLAAYRANL